MKLVVSRRAARRLREIADYIHERNPDAAHAVRQAIHDAFTLLVTYPEAGRVVEQGIRRFAVPRLPYLIYYTIDETTTTLNIATILHAAMLRES